MVSLFLRQCNHHLFQEGERFIDELCLQKSFTFWTSLFGALWSSQVHKIEFTDYDFLGWFDTGSDFQMNCKHAMRSSGVLIEFVLRDGSISFAFEELRYCVLFCEATLDLQSLDLHVARGILLDGESWVGIGTPQKIIHHFVINLEIGDADSYLLFVTSLNLLEEDTNTPRDETTIFVVNLGTHHGKGLPSTSLTIGHDSTWITAQCTMNYLFSTNVENNFLTSILKDLIESEAPILLLMINKS